MSEKIIIFDTTLRDGEQSPGASMTLEEKIRVADVLDSMGVDIIEAGFAMASNGDFEAVKQIAKRTKNSSVCSLSRAKKSDIERAAEAVKYAKRPRIHTFISTSDIHIKHQFKTTKDKILYTIADSVKLAKNLCEDVEWSAMDATRSDIDYLCQAIEIAIKNGATTINIPDTVGYALPNEFADLIKAIKNKVPNIDKAIISVHCQNDLGLATANTIAAIEAGARQAECTINGIGERAGNTSLEEVVMTLKTRNDLLDFKTDIDTKQIMRASRLVSNVSGFIVQNNKAIVGANAFAHESGIHQDGMLKHKNTYEIMDPEDVGWKKSEIVLGKHSGRHAFEKKLKELGFNLGHNSIDEKQFESAFNKFKDLADKKKKVYDDDIITLLDSQYLEKNNQIKFVSLEVSCGSKAAQIAEVTLKVDGKEKTAKATGKGPVDALFNAITDIIPHQTTLNLYQVHAVTEGVDAQAEVTVRLYDKEKDDLISGHGVDTDTLVASTLAYISALNKLFNYEKKEKI